MVKTAITSGGSYSDLAERLRTTIVGTDEEAGKLIKYAKQVTTDGINQFNRTYQKAVTDDLGSNGSGTPGQTYALPAHSAVR